MNSQRAFLAAMILAAAATATHSADNPAKLAASARFDVAASAEVRELNSGQIVAGTGTINRKNWLPAAEQARGYTVNFPITLLATNEVRVSFVPQAGGTVSLSLMGPWEEASKGVLFKQEVIWDALQVTGASLVEGAWSAPKRSWHNGPMAMNLKVAAKTPVTVQLKARPVVPAGFVEMKRITDRNSPAHVAAKRFLRGANFGNFLEVPPKQSWGLKHTVEDLAHMKAEGFDHVRIPIGWHHYAGAAPDFKLSDEIFSTVDHLVTNALSMGVNVLINIHHFDAFTTNPSAESNKFYAIWRQIAAQYAKAPPGLAFELINEPKDAATTLVLNPIYAEAIRVIRRTNPTRAIFVGPGKWNQVSELANLRLPDHDDNLIVTIHCYDPFQFTHQGATWSGPDTKVKGIQFPGPPAAPLVPDPSLNLRPHVLDWIKRYNTLPTEKNPSSPASFRSAIKQAKEWSDYYGRPMHMGEFGCYTQADAASRGRFHTEFRKALDEAGMGWALWDWKAGFKYWDGKTGQPAPGIREALFPKRD